VLKLIIAAALAFAAFGADFFPVAVWYGGGKARAPMLEANPRAKREAWRKDLRQIKQLGFNAIRCWIDWASGEPIEGQYQFDTIDVLLSLAQEEGLKVIIQIYMDAAPDWVGRKFPDSLYVSASGAVMKPESAPGYCRDHPGVRKAELAFHTALAESARRSPAFLGWDLWSEPHVINWATATYLTNAEFCFCPHSIARYRDWLRTKYGSLDRLNEAWYRRFTAWDQVEPNRLSTILSYSDYIDWRTFIQDKLGQDLRDRYEAVKRAAPDRVATSHAAAPNLFTSPLAGDGSPDDWTMRHQVDFYGTSFYPKHSYPVGRDPAWRGALLDFARSTGYTNDGLGFWIGELQAGFGTVALNVSGTVTPEDERIWMWSAIARGAKGINVYAWYPMSTGYESGGFGLINLDGTLTDRSRAAGEVARIVDRNQELFLKARPAAAHVAVVYNPLVYMVGGRQRAATTTGPQSEVAGIERDSMLGIYRALFPTNVPIDFIHIRELGDLSRYKLIYLQYPLMLPEASAQKFADYVKQGGYLVAEARLAWNNESGRAAEIIPGLGLHQAFGCREAAVQSIPGGWTQFIDESGARIPGRLYEETLEPSRPDARVVARFEDGRPAAVASKYGKGRTLALGSYISTAYNAKPGPAAQRFFEGLLKTAGVEAPVALERGQAEVRVLESRGERIVFVFNHESKPAECALHLRTGEALTDLSTGNPIEEALSLPAQSVFVGRIAARR
jgi:beta-galactosidase